MRKAQSPKETLLHVPEIPRPRVPSIIADQPSTTDRIKLDPVKSKDKNPPRNFLVACGIVPVIQHAEMFVKYF